MPLYEYECEDHGVIEKWVKLSEKEPTKCSIFLNWNGPACDKPLKKLMSHGYFYFNHHLKH